MMRNNRARRKKMPTLVSNRPDLCQTKDQVPVVGVEAAIRGDGRRPLLPLGERRRPAPAKICMPDAPAICVKEEGLPGASSSPSWGLIAVGFGDRDGEPTAPLTTRSVTTPFPGKIR
jgi:hypothetical protein